MIKTVYPGMQAPLDLEAPLSEDDMPLAQVLGLPDGMVKGKAKAKAKAKGRATQQTYRSMYYKTHHSVAIRQKRGNKCQVAQ
eukprot:3124816-Amphidinium_carterae.1